MKKIFKMASIMLVGAFILAGCSKDEDIVITQTKVYYLNGITLNGAGRQVAESDEIYDLSGKISPDDAVLIYHCTGQNSAGTYFYYTMLPYTNLEKVNYYYELGQGGILYLYEDAGEGRLFTSNPRLGTIKVVVVPHTITITMKSKGIDLSNYDEVAKYCNLPADDVASLSVAIPE